MELIVMLMIVGVFGVWIYGLKQEIASLRKRMPAEKAVPTEDLQATPAYAKSSPSASNGSSTSRDGVQTWVLE